ncbi:hypothetical protein [Paenibacillus zanthoxyli]|uniref:hypothetical protein n=1 Tax=Paenibacillus zanthoxyli TaxID=369399 RepID=UPI000470AF45|nr:hypothetical protein [Paenibacillus zanthoxyli]
MIVTKRSKILAALLLTIILLCTALLMFKSNQIAPVNTNQVQHTSSVVGLLSDQKNGSNFVVYDTKIWKPTVLLRLPEVTPDNYAALSRNGKYAAYTKWDEHNARRYLEVYTLPTGKIETFYQDMPIKNEIIKISWLPDNKTLLFIQNDARTFSYQEIKTFNIETREEKVLVHGEVWRVRAVEDTGKTAQSFYLKGKKTYLKVKEKKAVASYKKDDPINKDEQWNYYLNQKDIDKIYHYYGGKGTFSIEKVPNMMNVAFSAPRVSSDGTKVIYSTILDRSSAPGARTPLWMTASIWLYDLKSGQASMVYSQNDGGSIGRVDWVSGDEICFISYYDFQGSRDSVNYLRLSSKEHRILFPYSDEHYNNTTLLPIGNRQITFSSSKKDDFYEDSKTILFSIDSNTYHNLDIKMNNKNVLLEKFIYQELISQNAPK